MYGCFACVFVGILLSGQNWVSDPLELELWMVVGYHVGKGTEPGFSGGTASSLNHQATSPFPLHEKC